MGGVCAPEVVARVAARRFASRARSIGGRSKSSSFSATDGPRASRIDGAHLRLVVSLKSACVHAFITKKVTAKFWTKVAVRMSMGIPGAFEPFKYEGHVYCDGGMINDFPIAVLPDKLHQFIENDRKVLLRFFCGRSSACTTTATACTPVRAAPVSYTHLTLPTKA